MRVILYNSDDGGCCHFTCKQPFKELMAYGVRADFHFSLPSDEGAPGSSLGALVNQISRYDLVVVQRITSLELMKFIKKACHLTDKPLIYINDDDYLHLEHHNPCFFSTALDGMIARHRDLLAAGKVTEAKLLEPMLEQQRVQGLNEFKEALSIPDGIITTTEELKQVFSPYNKNILVKPNCVEQIFYERDHVVEEFHPPGSIGQNAKGEWVDVSGHLKVDNKFGMANIPSFWVPRDPKTNEPNGAPNRILRIGYAGTVSHQHDWETIREPWKKLVEKYNRKVWFTYIGDPYFADQAMSGRDRRHWIRDAQYSVYRANLRNLDVAIAPLSPTPFNMGKSDIKAVEAASWGTPCVLPNYITYTRSFKHGETALFYNNGKEFFDMMEIMINNHVVRKKLGKAAREYVATYRLEECHGKRLFEWLSQMVQLKPRINLVY